MRWTVAEIVGVALIAVALGLWHVELAIGWVGLYLLVTGVLNQMGDTNGEG